MRMALICVSTPCLNLKPQALKTLTKTFHASRQGSKLKGIKKTGNSPSYAINRSV